jgi:adenylate cyclase
MPTLNTLQAIMFADISGSSALYKNSGNQQAKALVDNALNFMASCTTLHGGTVVKTIGDEIMARFNHADAACETAVAIQQRSHRDFADIGIRIGIAFGNTVITSNDAFGDTVNDAACVAHIARAHQIVLTQGVVDQLNCTLAQQCQLFDRINIKGESHKTIIYRFAWEVSGQQNFATQVLPIQDVSRFLANFQLRLILHDKTIILLPDQTPFMIGRDANKADLFFDEVLCSREHCHIEFRRGKYVLIDHSTNGTYVRVEHKAPIYLRREETTLQGSGVIGIGQHTDLTHSSLIHYSH